MLHTVFLYILIFHLYTKFQMPTSNGSLMKILCDINGTSQFCCPTFSYAEAFKFNASCKKNVNIT